MEEIKGEEFYQLLKSPDLDLISNSIIDLSIGLTIDINKITLKNKIHNCIFKGRVEITNLNLSDERECIHVLNFNDCHFDQFLITGCHFHEITFSNIKGIGNLFSVSNLTINFFKIDTTDILNEAITIHHNIFNKEFHLKEVKLGKGNFGLRKNKFPTGEENFYHQCIIHKCQFLNCDISENDFGTDLSFTNNFLSFQKEYSQNYFRTCTFNTASFSETDFGNLCEFKKCTFNEIIKFDLIKNDITTVLKFSNCAFKSTISFQKAKLYNVCFYNTTFESFTLFQDCNFDSIKIDNSVFEKTTFFDNVRIKDIDSCDRRTLRNIKQQLQKAENKIDYNRFRSYELSAYYRELTWRANFKDWFILFATKWVTGFDHSWRRALIFTLVAGFIFYSLFFISDNHFNQVDIAGWKQYVSGYFRFLLVTDFYNPLENGRTYIHNSNTIGWFIFILGKIVIAFGIYEMIQAFRKFKA